MERVAISQHRTSVLFTSHLQDGLVVNFYILHNRRMPLQAEEALGPISIPRGSRGVCVFGVSTFWHLESLWWNKNLAMCKKCFCGQRIKLHIPRLFYLNYKSYWCLVLHKEIFGSLQLAFYLMNICHGSTL